MDGGVADAGSGADRNGGDASFDSGTGGSEDGGGRGGIDGMDDGVADAGFGAEGDGGDGSLDASVAPTLSGDIQPLFSQTCALAGCHVLPAPIAGLVLSAGMTYSQTVGVISQENPPMKRVAAGDAQNSYLYLKITGRQVAGTLPQPPPSTGIALTPAQKDMVRDWINAGAKND